MAEETKDSIEDLTTAGIGHNEQSKPPAPLSASKLVFTRTSSPRTIPAPDSPELWSCSESVDHMVTCQWMASTGWQTPEIRPFAPFDIMPTASAIHYATQCFEGMKVYRGVDGKLRLFRPNLNAERLVMSAGRVMLPAFDPKEMVKLIGALLRVDGPRWLPKDKPGYLYLRPALIATGEQLGLQMPDKALLFIIAVPWPDLAATPPGKPPKTPGLKLLASKRDSTRAWPGGFGSAKVGANYGPAFTAQHEAASLGYDQILWLLGDNAEVTEAGASNFFVIWKNKSGQLECVTSPLHDKVILAGVTRRSVLDLLSQGFSNKDDEKPEDLKIIEKKFTMQEIVEAEKEGRLVECFVSGTAFFITPVSAIHFRGLDVKIPMSEGDGGKYANILKKKLGGIMYGEIKHEWGVVIEDEDSGHEFEAKQKRKEDVERAKVRDEIARLQKQLESLQC